MKMLTRYYPKHKKGIRNKDCEQYTHLPEEERNKTRQYARKRYTNLSEVEKTKSVNMVVSDTEIFQKMKNKG